jgi:hypothetical protein
MIIIFIKFLFCIIIVLVGILGVLLYEICSPDEMDRSEK